MDWALLINGESGFILRFANSLNKEILHTTASIVQKDFYFENLHEMLPQNEEDALEELKRQLAQRIAHMMDDDFEALLQVFYRIDLGERAVNNAIHLSDVPSEKLAELVIEREIQKAKTRIEYAKRSKLD